MIKLLLATLTLCLLGACTSTSIAPSKITPSTTKMPLSASQIIERAGKEEWRLVDSENIIKVFLPTGAVYIELNPLLAPKHVKQIKLLAREGFYKNTNVYRFVEGFVAQGGDNSGKKEIKTASEILPAEFYLTTSTPLFVTELEGDGYAPVTGFINGFAVAQNEARTQTWQVHCSGVFAMARDSNVDSANTEFFITLGQNSRYLDKNITVFGKVLEGMEHVNRLAREPSEGMLFNPITDIRVLADITNDSSEFKVMKTNSISFKQLIKARKNRTESWFVQSYNYVDVCAMPIPSKRTN
jgi:peptidylprolyl isomerase